MKYSMLYNNIMLEKFKIYIFHAWSEISFIVILINLTETVTFEIQNLLPSK